MAQELLLRQAMRVTVAWTAFFLLSACSAEFGIQTPGPGGHPHVGEPPRRASCDDPDGDGYGAGAGCRGPDCNESVATVHTDEQCTALCESSGNLASGCPCAGSDPQPCYGGPDGSLGVGTCRAGTMACESGRWGACEGQMLPRIEHCDAADDDCNGEIDNGVMSSCGICDPECSVDCVGLGCADPFDPEADGARSLVLTPEGALTLDRTPTVTNHVIWVANSGEGTVTKIDTRTRVETGRYWTGWGGAGDSPSRTTVNPRGDVVVANRGGGGEATKYYASDCPDVNGDGIIQTSTGAGDVRPFQQDECWAWTTAVGGGARGSAFEVRVGLDGIVEEYVWVGDYTHMDVHEIDSETGALTGRSVGGVNPYGLAMAPGGKLWTFAGGAIVGIDTTDLTTEVIPVPAGESFYGITADNQGRVWIGGTVARYDPATGLWASPGAHVCGGGIAVDRDGNAWVGEGVWGWRGYCEPSAWRIDADTLDATEIAGAGGHGWAIDFDGYAWSIEFVGTRAFVVDPDTLVAEAIQPPFVSAYTYSDMTGFQLVNAVSPVGTYPLLVEGCDRGSVTWGDLSWEADVPENTSLSFRAKTAADVDALEDAPFVDLGTAPPGVSPISIDEAFTAAGVAHANLLLLDTKLMSADADSAPLLRSLRVSRRCPPEIE